LKLEERTRWPVRPNSRVYFVVLHGKDKLYLRTETPEHAIEHKLQLDMEYYLKNQFGKPVKKLLTYHPELFNFDELFDTYMKRIKLKANNMTDVSNFMTMKKRKLTLEEFAANKKSKADSKIASSSSSSSKTKSDRFASLVKRMKK
jgi:hypothetical protein